MFGARGERAMKMPVISMSMNDESSEGDGELRSLARLRAAAFSSAEEFSKPARTRLRLLITDLQMRHERPGTAVALAAGAARSDHLRVSFPK